ncbi:MAG: hypothetical protein EF813_09450 [Methanosarcinales archaeon]|nr:MAG: hypothetical protein EF813_09450 [Methanosarcinales archaeon]
MADVTLHPRHSCDDIRAIRSFVPFVILYADFITNFTNVPNATNFNRLFSGKPLESGIFAIPHAHITRPDFRLLSRVSR